MADQENTQGEAPEEPEKPDVVSSAAIPTEEEKHGYQEATEEWNDSPEQDPDAKIKAWLQRLRGVEPDRQVELFFAFAIALFALCSVGVGWMQRNEMHNAGDQTDKIICADDRIAAAMEGALGQSKKTLDAGIEQNRLEQRAWIGIATVDPFSLVPTASFGLRFNLANSGRTPALHIKSLIVLRSEPVKEKFAPIYGNSPAGINPSDSVALPNGTFFLDTPRYPVSQAQVNAIKSGAIRLYVYGIITYEDVFKKGHITRFCKFIIDSNEAEDCNTYNYAD